jgi:hypothetical protein
MSALLKRLAPLASTGVGSLPFTRAAEAAHHATRAYDVPFCPQLPHLHGDMIDEWLGADPGRCGWTPDRDRQLPGAWDQFVGELRRHPPHHGVVKLQVTGPVTLATALERAAGRPGATRETHRLAAEIAMWLAASATEQVAALDELGLAVLLVVDEPGLAAAGLDRKGTRVWDPLRRAAGAWGLHVCGQVPWELVDAAEVDVASIDIARYGLDADAVAVLGRLLGRGGRVIWGAIDPVRPGDAAAAAGRVSAGAAALAGTLSPSAVAAASMVSPSCGTGRISIESERRVAAILAASVEATRAAIGALGTPQAGPQVGVAA